MHKTPSIEGVQLVAVEINRLVKCQPNTHMQDKLLTITINNRNKFYIYIYIYRIYIMYKMSLMNLRPKECAQFLLEFSGVVYHSVEQHPMAVAFG